MSKKRGLGNIPFDEKKQEQIKEGIGIERSKESKTSRRKTVKKSKSQTLPDKKNFYLKDGKIYQKVTVSLPWELTKDLKKKAIDTGKSLSGLIEDLVTERK